MSVIDDEFRKMAPATLRRLLSQVNLCSCGQRPHRATCALSSRAQRAKPLIDTGELK